MKEAKKLPWGEKHLIGNLYTVKVAVGMKLFEIMSRNGNFKLLRGCLWTYHYASPKLRKMFADSERPIDPDMVLMYGCLSNYEYNVYQHIKRRAQAQIKLEQATELFNDSNVYKTLAGNHKPLEDETSEVLDPASVA